MLGEILSTLNIGEKLVRLLKWLKEKRHSAPESVPARFIRLFESHNVHRNQIPRFFGHGLTLKDVQSDADLVLKLDETLLQAACDLFAVRREWLDGAEKQIFPIHRFYKHPNAFLEFIDALRAASPDKELSGVVLAPIEPGPNAEAVLVLHETVGWVGDKAIYRYYFCDQWTLSYWKSRAYLTACVAIAWQQRVFIHGVYAYKERLQKITGGLALPTWSVDGIGSFVIKRWNPEDMALRPEVFLDGLDPERDNFGFQAGLRLWLSLFDDGFMNTGLGTHNAGEIRKSFNRALEQIDQCVAPSLQSGNPAHGAGFRPNGRKEESY